MTFQLPTRTVLALIVLAVAVPVGLFAAALIDHAWRQQAAVVDRQNIDTARAMLVAVDQEVQKTAAVLTVIGALDFASPAALGAPGALPAASASVASPSAAPGPVASSSAARPPVASPSAAARFQQTAPAVVARQTGWRALFLLDAKGQRLAATPDHASITPDRSVLDLPPAAALVRDVVTSGRPGFSDLIEHPTDRKYVYLAAMPVSADDGGAVQWILVAEISTQTLSDLLRRQNAPPNGVVTLIDRTRRIMARTRAEEKFVGQSPSPNFQDAAKRMQEGVWRGVLLEGTPAYSALSRSHVTGWTIGLGLPASEVDALVQRSLWMLAGAGVLMVAIGLIAATLFGNLMIRALDDCAMAAESLADEKPVNFRRSRISEVARVGRSLTAASELQHQRLHEREVVEAARNETAIRLQTALAAEQAALVRAQTAREEAETLSRAKDEFLATLSHELRTPLNAILGWAQMLRRGQVNGDARVRAMEIIERNARVQAQLVDDLLDMSRVVRGRVHLDMRDLKLAPIIEAVFDSVRPAADAKDITLSLDDRLTDDVAGDAARLQQIFWNLLTNSTKFTERGGRIEARLFREGSEAVVQIADDGRGIPRDLLPHVFERFRQGSNDTIDGRGGLGIGLSLVRHLVELHGGTVAADSPGEGQGATFTVRLPILGPQAIHSTAAPGEHAGARLDGVSLLVVEDEQDSRDLIGITLTHAGADPTLVPSVDSAIAVMDARTRAFDVIITDVGMPGRNGYELLRHVRGTPNLSRIPVIALSALERREDQESALGVRFDAYLEKPIESRALADAVAAALGRT